MHVIIGDQKVNLTEGSNGRLQATFTATENTDSILIPSDCIGTLKVNDIQLEQGTQATPFVEPAVQSEDMSGIFKDLHELRIGIKDTQEGLSHKITINQEGLEQLISDAEERLNSRITLTADTWQGELEDTERGLNNQITATANFWQRKLTDTERGLRNVIQSKADSLVALVEDKEKGLSNQIVVNQRGLEQLISNTEDRLDSRITLMADTWQGELNDAKRGLNNQITATAGLWQTKLSDTERDLRSAIQLKADSLIALVEDTEKGLDNQITATARLWQTKLSDTERGLRNAIQARADSLITLIEDTDSANFTKTEQLVNGLQSTVQGDLRSQRTQLENLISSRIESATGSRSTIWQTLNSHGMQLSANGREMSRIEQRVDSYSRRISDVEGDYSLLEQTVLGLNSEVHGYNGEVQSRFRQLRGLIDQRVTRNDVEGIIQNSGDSIWLAIGDKVNNIGGRNLIRNSNDMVWTPVQGSSVNVYNSSRLEGGTYVSVYGGETDLKTYHDFTNKITDVEEGKTYTFSVIFYNGSVNEANVALTGLNARSQTVRGGQTTRLVFTGTRSSVRLQLHVRTTRNNIPFHVVNPQLEKGEIATDWSPAPEDGVNKNELISEINIQANRQIFRVGDNRLMLTEDTTYISNALIKSAHIADLSVTSAKIANAAITDAKIASLDVSKLSGNTARFVQLGIQGINRNITLDNRGININRNNGSRAALLDETGYHFWRDGKEHARMDILQATDTSGPFQGRYSVSLAAEHTAYVGLSYRPKGESNFKRAIGVVGSTGDIFMDNITPNPTYQATGIEFARGHVGKQVGMFIRHKNANRAGIFFGGNGRVYIKVADGGYKIIN